MTQWVRACARYDIDTEDLIRYYHDGRTFAIHRSPGDKFCCTDGLCTHVEVHLADSLVMDHVIECLGLDGQFDNRKGEPKHASARDLLQTCPVQVTGDDVLIGQDGLKAPAGQVAVECSLTDRSR